MEDKYIVIMTSCSDKETKKKIIDKLLSEKLAACIQVLDIKSYYTWKGKVENSDEFLLLIKTRKSLFSKAKASIKENHNYDTPEIISLDIEDGHRDYFQWINEVTFKN